MLESQEKLINKLWSNLRFDHSYLAELDDIFSKHSNEFDIQWKWQVNAMKSVILSKIGDFDKALMIAKSDITEIDHKEHPYIFMVRAIMIADLHNKMQNYDKTLSFIEKVIFKITYSDRIGIYDHYIKACRKHKHVVPVTHESDMYFIIEEFGDLIDKSDIISDYSQFYDGYRKDGKKYSTLIIKIQDLNPEEAKIQLSAFINECKTKFYRNEAIETARYNL